MKTPRWALRDGGQEVGRVESPARSASLACTPTTTIPTPTPRSLLRQDPQTTEPPAPLSSLTLHALRSSVLCTLPPTTRCQAGAQPWSPSSAQQTLEVRHTPQRAAQTSVPAPNTQHPGRVQV